MKERLKSVKAIAYKHARLAGCEPDVSKEIAQMAMLKVAPTLEGNSEFLADPDGRRAYVYKIVANALKAARKIVAVHQRLQPPLIHHRESQRSSRDNPESVLDVMQTDWEKAQVNEAALLLSQRDRQLLADYVDGIPGCDLADARGKTEGALRLDLKRTLERLREAFLQMRAAKHRRGDTP